MSIKQIEFTIIVNGHPVPIKVNVNKPMRVAVEKALKNSGNSGQPIDNWELRDASGQILDLGKEIEDFVLEKDTKLYLNLKAGVGG